MDLHSLFGRHDPDLKASRWDEGRFVTSCTVCGRPMVKPPGGGWVLARPRHG
ncbi:MAG: hypothetical protein ABW128_12225 [Rhizorhabdus sp.]